MVCVMVHVMVHVVVHVVVLWWFVVVQLWWFHGGLWWFVVVQSWWFHGGFWWFVVVFRGSFVVVFLQKSLEKGHLTLYLSNQRPKFTMKSHFWWDLLSTPFHLKSIPLNSSAKNISLAAVSIATTDALDIQALALIPPYMHVLMTAHSRDITTFV